MTAPDLPPDVSAEQQTTTPAVLPPADQQQYDALRAAVRRMQDRHDTKVRAAAYRQCAADLDADADRLATRDPRAAEVLNGASYLIRDRADRIAPTTETPR